MHEDDSWLDWILDQVGEPKPCGICGRRFRAELLTETTVPAGFIDLAGEPSVLHQVLWLCADCRSLRR